jgi:hypothetical protein
MPTVSPPYGIEAVAVSLRRGQANGWTADLVLRQSQPAHHLLSAAARLAGPRLTPILANGRRSRQQHVEADFRLINPVGFDTEPGEGVIALSATATGETVALHDDRVVIRIPAGAPVTEADVAALRPYRGLVVHPNTAADVDVLSRLVPALAMAGIPLQTMGAALSEEIDPRLAGVIGKANPAVFDDRLLREEHSIRVRRAALAAAGCGAPIHGSIVAPALSVLLCTRREDMIEFAIEQLRRQRGVDFELVLGLHGSWHQPERAGRLARSVAKDCHVMEISADVTFGAALNRLAATSAGSLLLKMDDDDFYGPDFLSDLLLARDYSQADVVGCVAEFVFLEHLDVTIRRAWVTEGFGSDVSGGCLMISRAAFDAVGGFRSLDQPGPEDVLIQQDVRSAGGMTYRTHGLNYVLRRRPVGHTWQVDDDYFLKSAVLSRPGLSGSSLLENQTVGPEISNHRLVPSLSV